MDTYKAACEGKYKNKLPYEGYKKNPEVHRAYMIEEVRLTHQFRNDLEAEYEMSGHPKADLLWQKAWDDGHASGLSEVATCYGNLVELVK